MIVSEATILFLVAIAAGAPSMPVGARLAFQLGCVGLGIFVWVFGA